MGCDGGLLSAGGSVEPLMCVVQELCNLYHGGACLDVKCRVKSGQVVSSRYKSGQSGRYFFSGNCCRYAFASVFPFPESIPGSGSLSTTLIHDFRRRRTQVGPLAVGGAECRVRTLQVGLSRAEAGSFPIYGLLRLASRTFPRCLCWAMGRQIIRSLQSCKGPPSPSDSQPVGVMGS
jgi:hypothetical protein